VINKPAPFYIIHAKKILITGNLIIFIFFVFLLASSFVIVRAYRKLRKTNKALAEARKKAENLSLHDTLTGLLNRRGLEQMINYEINRKRRFDNSVSFLMVDIDYFKSVNDTFGHVTGDLVLKQVAETLTNGRRSTDLVSRWGGEEFLILLTNTSESQAMQIAEKLRIACSQIVLNDSHNITVSIGVAEVMKNETFESWFKRVDMALYTAKNSGRNKIVAASSVNVEDIQDCYVKKH